VKDLFIEAYRKNITREGAYKLLDWLSTSDFFDAPASTRHHLAEVGGLARHSHNVWRRLRELVLAEQSVGDVRLDDIGDEPALSSGKFDDINEETLAICGLLHDICKVNYYKTEMRNAKDETGQWIKVPYYTIDDQLPYGHGEKSVYIISGFMRLSRVEAMAIRWHMGGFDDSVKGGGYAMSTAFGKFPLAVLLHIADLQATYIDETG
jgi:hypothetical protein